MKLFTSPSQQTGQLGETLAEKWLLSHGFTIIDRNIGYSCGEIDILTQKDSCLHFFEVKSSTIYTTIAEAYNAAENITPTKLRRCHAAIRQYFTQNPRMQYQLDALIVYIQKDTLSATIQYLENISQ